VRAAAFTLQATKNEMTKTISQAANDATSSMLPSFRAYLAVSAHDPDYHVSTSRAVESIIITVDEVLAKLATLPPPTKCAHDRRARQSPPDDAAHAGNPLVASAVVAVQATHILSDGVALPPSLPELCARQRPAAPP
jgi:hypothetical protein